MRLGDPHVSYHINSIMVTYSTMNYSTNSYKFRLVCKCMVHVSFSISSCSSCFLNDM